MAIEVRMIDLAVFTCNQRCLKGNVLFAAIRKGELDDGDAKSERPELDE